MDRHIKYIVESARDALWGLSVSTVGYETIAPGAPYPSDRHLDGYRFSTESGRVLGEYQLVYIPQGRGTFRSASLPATPIGPGTIFLLFPGEWHTYAPDPANGWTQYWIGFKGANMDARVANGFLDRREPIFSVGVSERIVRMYMEAVEVASSEKPFFQQTLAGIANYLIGLVYSLDRGNTIGGDSRLSGLIDRARVMMRENIDTPLSIQDIASRLGMSYSSFRKAFKKYTGQSPAQYHMHLRLLRAQDLLSSTSLPVKEIAYMLRFESADYFSTLFRRKTGLCPGDLRATPRKE